MLVSVVTPTYGRERFLPLLYESFRGQNWPDLELVIADDSPEPSSFFRSIDDPRVRYLHKAERRSTGAKRNFLVESARGEVIVLFDDDDYYAPDYVRFMVEALGTADLVKLSAWFAYAVQHDAFLYWDTAVTHAQHFKVAPDAIGFVKGERFIPEFIPNNLDGYGFSYVFRRAAATRIPFPDKSLGEDIVFVRGLRRSGREVRHARDETGLVLHILHGGNHSLIYPQYRLPSFLVSRLFPTLPAGAITKVGR